MATINSHCFLCHVQYKRCDKGSGVFGKKIRWQASPWSLMCPSCCWHSSPANFSNHHPRWSNFSARDQVESNSRSLTSERDLFFSRNYCTDIPPENLEWTAKREEMGQLNKTLCGDKTVQQNPALVGGSLVPWLQGFNGVHVLDLRCWAAERRSLSGDVGELDPYLVLIEYQSEPRKNSGKFNSNTGWESTRIPVFGAIQKSLIVLITKG